MGRSVSDQDSSVRVIRCGDAVGRVLVRPDSVETSGSTVVPLVGVTSKIIALRLNQIGRHIRTSVGVEVTQRRAHGRNGDA